MFEYLRQRQLYVCKINGLQATDGKSVNAVNPDARTDYDENREQDYMTEMRLT